jgi:hypothetical protein
MRVGTGGDLVANGGLALRAKIIHMVIVPPGLVREPHGERKPHTRRVAFFENA